MLFVEILIFTSFLKACGFAWFGGLVGFFLVAVGLMCLRRCFFLGLRCVNLFARQRRLPSCRIRNEHEKGHFLRGQKRSRFILNFGTISPSRTVKRCRPGGGLSRTDVETSRFTLESEKKKGAISETKNGLAFVSNSEPFSRHALFVTRIRLGFVTPKQDKNRPHYWTLLGAHSRFQSPYSKTNPIVVSCTGFLPLPPSSSFVLLPPPFLLLPPPFRLPSSSVFQPSQPAQLAQPDDPASRATESREFRKKLP